VASTPPTAGKDTPDRILAGSEGGRRSKAPRPAAGRGGQRAGDSSTRRPPPGSAGSPSARNSAEGPSGPAIFPVDFAEERVDAEAAKVVRRLTRHGHEAYLVGGCVRDLLVDRAPKDFDVATSARPDDVRRLFRNSRLIGRRFRLIHVLFGGGKVIETATFRRAPQQSEEREGDDLLIRNDNVFGDAHEDAARRDFTINGLFYDLEHRRVLDWVNGMPDIERRTVQTIGDPVVRFLEDPVRILRAIKFSARLDFGISPDVYDAIVQCRSALSMAARPRLFEELLRLLRGGAAHRSIWLAWETGVLDVMLPELAAYLADAELADGVVWRLLTEVDNLSRERGAPLDDIVLMTTLLLEPMIEACSGAPDRVEAAYEFLDPVVDRLNIPRRIADAMRRLVAVLPRLEEGRAARFARTSLFPVARDVLLLRARSSGKAPDSQVEVAQAAPAAVHTEEEPSVTKRRRRRRTRRVRPE
jgi:poly(A) polymerase